MKKTIWLIIGLAIILVVYLTCFSVNEAEYVVVTQFGKPVKEIYEPGLYVKLPGFLQTVNRIDKRTNIFKPQLIQLLLGDKNPVIVACYVCWNVSDPLLFFQSLTTVDIAQQRIGDMINSQLGSVMGDYQLSNIINTDASEIKIEDIESAITANSNEKAKEKYGITIAKVGIRRLAYPSIVADAVYDRMKAERNKEAMKFRAEGDEEATKIKAQADRQVAEMLADAYKEAEIIKGEGDQQATQIYADAYMKDKDFYEFMKSMEVYKEIIKEKATLILSMGSKLFKHMREE